jgi:hypothetical protein
VGHIVYVAGNEQRACDVIRQAGTENVCHVLDLSQPPDALLLEISRLAYVITKELTNLKCKLCRL